MTIIDDIRECFASKQSGVRRLYSLSDEYSAYSFREAGEYGVFVNYPKSSKAVSEHFAGCRIYTREVSFEKGEPVYGLFLSCPYDDLMYEFASVCSEFVEPGVDGDQRHFLTEHPLEWWERWKSLLGNRDYEAAPYDVIGEMEVLNYLLDCGSDAEWTAMHAGTHDIETMSESVEVKSTIKKDDATITISSQRQLESDKTLFLYFCRYEHSISGKSINDMEKELIDKGYKQDKIEKHLESMGYEYGASVRDEKYRLTEKRKYLVNDKFPKITDESFVGGHRPANVIKIIYSVDLNDGGIEYTNW